MYIARLILKRHPDKATNDEVDILMFENKSIYLGFTFGENNKGVDINGFLETPDIHLHLMSPLDVNYIKL